LLVVRDDDPRAESSLVAAADAELARSLVARAGFGQVAFSPVPFADVVLAAECQGHRADCLQRVASKLESPWILVRTIQVDLHGETQITLFAPETGVQGVTRQVSSPLNAQESPQAVVPRLVAQLYPQRPSSPSRAPAKSDPLDAGARIAGYVSMALAGPLLASGITMSVLAGQDERTYDGVPATAQTSAQHEALDRAHDRAQLGRVLWGSGAAVGLAGAGLLLWSYLAERRRVDRGGSRMRVSATPLRDGGGVWLVGSFGGERP
jgi:hypothetical protein